MNLVCWCLLLSTVLCAKIDHLSYDAVSNMADYIPEVLGSLGRANKAFRRMLNQKYPQSLQLAKSLKLPFIEFIPLDKQTADSLIGLRAS